MRKITFILCSIVLFSCTEKTKVNLISGTLNQDCNSTVPNVELALKANGDGSFTDPLIFGSAFTNQEGNFSFTYELEEEDIGSGSLILVNSTGFETIITTVELNEDQILNLYLNSSTEVVINLGGNRTYNFNDTLYYGLTQVVNDYFIVQPTIGEIDRLRLELNSPNANFGTNGVYYGIGIQEFTRARNAAFNSDSTFQNFQVTLANCNTSQTVSIEID